MVHCLWCNNFYWGINMKHFNARYSSENLSEILQVYSETVPFEEKILRIKTILGRITHTGEGSPEWINLLSLPHTRDDATILRYAALRGDLEMVDWLLSQGVDPEGVHANTHGVFPLYSAIRFGHVEVVKSLLKAGALFAQGTYCYSINGNSSSNTFCQEHCSYLQNKRLETLLEMSKVHPEIHTLLIVFAAKSLMEIHSLHNDNNILLVNQLNKNIPKEAFVIKCYEDKKIKQIFKQPHDISMQTGQILGRHFPHAITTLIQGYLNQVIIQLPPDFFGDLPWGAPSDCRSISGLLEDTDRGRLSTTTTTTVTSSSSSNASTHTTTSSGSADSAYRNTSVYSSSTTCIGTSTAVSSTNITSSSQNVYNRALIFTPSRNARNFENTDNGIAHNHTTMVTTTTSTTTYTSLPTTEQKPAKQYQKT